jgi:hypothetical protein
MVPGDRTSVFMNSRPDVLTRFLYLIWISQSSFMSLPIHPSSAFVFVCTFTSGSSSRLCDSTNSPMPMVHPPDFFDVMKHNKSPALNLLTHPDHRFFNPQMQCWVEFLKLTPSPTRIIQTFAGDTLDIVYCSAVQCIEISVLAVLAVLAVWLFGCLAVWLSGCFCTSLECRKISIRFFLIEKYFYSIEKYRLNRLI